MIKRQNTRTCIVVGAGISGLMAARTLQEHGLQVTVLDKGRGVGGRMSTRRIGSAVFDHGAQFFTAREPKFSELVNTWLVAGVAQEWCRSFAIPDNHNESRGELDGHPRYCSAAGMTRIPKYLAENLNILLEQQVESVKVHDQVWKVITNLGDTFTADGLILTAPVPQSLALLDNGGTKVSADYRTELEAIRYDPCIALMLRPIESRVPKPGGIQISDGPISWIGDNKQKGISAREAITIHAQASFSRENWELPDEEIASKLLTAASEWVTATNSNVHIHRWRYARPAILYPAPCLILGEPLPIAFAGDAFGAPRVEGAALSGIAAASAILDTL